MGRCSDVEDESKPFCGRQCLSHDTKQQQEGRFLPELTLRSALTASGFYGSSDVYGFQCELVCPVRWF